LTTLDTREIDLAFATVYTTFVVIEWRVHTVAYGSTTWQDSEPEGRLTSVYRVHVQNLRDRLHVGGNNIDGAKCGM
jgi:hypothetical protein